MFERYGCLWILLAIVAALFGLAKVWEIFFPVTQASYEACVARVNEDRKKNVAICVRDYLQSDIEKSRIELPVLPSRREREADCQFIWRDTPPNDCKRPTYKN
jgi:hypothetical protein